MIPDVLPGRQPAAYVQELERLMRTILAMVPGGVGDALNIQIFDRLRERNAQRLEAFVQDLSVRLQRMESSQRRLIRKQYFDTDEFRYILREVLIRVAKEHRQAKVSAFRSILLNSMCEDPRQRFDRKLFFVEVLDILTPEHLQLLILLQKRSMSQNTSTVYVKVEEIWRVMTASDEATRNYLYSGLDTLANRQLLLVGPIPMKTKNIVEQMNEEPRDLQHYSIQKPEQSYALSDLGKEFLALIRDPETNLAE